MILLEDHFARRVHVVARQAERSFAVALSNSSDNRDDFREYYRDCNQGFRLRLLKQVVKELEERALKAGLSRRWSDVDKDAWWKRCEGTPLLLWFLRSKCLRALSLMTGKCPVSAAELLYMTLVLRTAANRIETEPFKANEFIESRMDLLSVQAIICQHSFFQDRLSLLNAVEHYFDAPHPQPKHLKSFTLAELGFIE
jgi:hypothetical protein